MSDTFDLYKKKTIKHLAENVLSRIDVVNSSGLYNGKAGIAIGLFEAAKFLNDTSIEDKAFRLFQESLIIKNRDLSFENGLPGIGYTLLYMIENEFIETDFIEIFEEEYELIIKRYIEIEKEPSRLLSSFKAIYFFRKAVEITKDDRIKKIIRKFFEGLELYLAIHFLDFSDKLYINNKFFV